MFVLTRTFRQRWMQRSTLVVAISLPLVAGLGIAARAEMLGAAVSVSVPPLSIARSQHTATLLPDGRVLVVGGNTLVTTTEIYDPATNEWRAAGNMRVVRTDHSATLLPNGQVLVVGSTSSDYPPFTAVSTELYNPGTDRWIVTSAPAVARSGQTATLLGDGSVLVAGGSGAVTVSERYTPATGVWTEAGNMRTVRRQATATRLPDGRVLVFGGQFGLAVPEIYDPAREVWQAAAAPTHPEVYGQTATLLADGRVLVAGGFGTTGGYYPAPNSILPAQTELYSSTSNTWALGPAMNVARRGHTTTLLPDGRVLVVGGWTGFQQVSSSVEIYDPVRNRWYLARDLATARSNHTATLLADGTVLIVGGAGANGQLASVERYDPRDAVLDVRHYLPWLSVRRLPDPPVFPTPAFPTRTPNAD